MLCDGVARCVYSRPLWQLVAGEEVGRLKAMCAHQEYLDRAQPHQILSQWCRISLSRKKGQLCRSPGVTRRVPSRVPNTADCGDGAHQESRAPRGGPSMPLPPRSAVLARACPTATPRSQTVVSCAQCTRRGTLSCCRDCVALTLALLVSKSGNWFQSARRKQAQMHYAPLPASLRGVCAVRFVTNKWNAHMPQAAAAFDEEEFHRDEEARETLRSPPRSPECTLILCVRA